MRNQFTRRDFIRLSSLFAGSLIVPGRLFASDYRPLRRLTDPKKVIIIGAGMAGMTAALELKKAGHQVVILEAQTRPGGRVKTMREPFAEGFTAELGAGRIPDNNDWTLKFVKDFGLELTPFYPTSGNTFHYLRDQMITYEMGTEPNLDDFPIQLNPMEKDLGVHGLFEKSVGEKMAMINDRENWPPESLHSLDDKTLRQFLSDEGWSDDVYEVLGLNPFDEISSLEALAVMGNGHGTQSLSKVAGGNDLLPKALAKELTAEIFYGAPVERIKQTSEGVEVAYSKAGQKLSMSADKLISAIPFSVLRHMVVEPDFPYEKQKVIQEMGYVPLSRFTFQVGKRYWMEMGLNGFGYDGDIGGEFWHPTFDIDSDRGLLQLYLYGMATETVTTLSKSQREQYGIERADLVFPGIGKHLEGVWYYNWFEDPWAQGAARTFYPGQVVDSFKVMSRAEGNIHFAGEHTSTWLGYINGAIESGIRASREVNDS